MTAPAADPTGDQYREFGARVAGALDSYLTDTPGLPQQSEGELVTYLLDIAEACGVRCGTPEL